MSCNDCHIRCCPNYYFLGNYLNTLLIKLYNTIYLPIEVWKELIYLATKMGINTKWTTEVLLDAILKNFINTFKEFKELLDTMIDNILWIEKDFYISSIKDVKRIFDE
ncbi:MAG: hypothetical protein EU518_01945 [Promethearchaeota archaeon]|nr:MAG: hypothetical protein EU518_01945 [Candidatus Lokiarchaeota archaeon]